MSYYPGGSEMNSVLIDLIRNTPPSPGKQRALIRLLWHDAAGPTISQHVTIRKCHPDGRIEVEVNDNRWMKPIRDSARLIIQRINTALSKMGMEEYSVFGLDMFPAPPKPPVARKPATKSRKISIPPHIQKRIDALPESLRKNVSDWYRAAQENQSADTDDEN